MSLLTQILVLADGGVDMVQEGPDGQIDHLL